MLQYATINLQVHRLKNSRNKDEDRSFISSIDLVPVQK